MGWVKGTEAQVKESFINQPAWRICLDKPSAPSGMEGPAHTAEFSREESRMNAGVRERGMEGGKRKWKINALGPSIPLLRSFVLILEVSFHF